MRYYAINRPVGLCQLIFAEIFYWKQPAMQAEFKIKDYGLKQTISNNLMQLASQVQDPTAVLFLGGGKAAYGRGGSLYRIDVPEEEPSSLEGARRREALGEKVFAKMGGATVRVVERGGVIAVFNNDGRIKLVDREGVQLRSMDVGRHPINAVEFLSEELIAVGGEGGRLCIYRTTEERPLYTEEGFKDYVESIASNGTHMAVGTLDGEVHLYKYSVEEKEECDGTVRRQSEQVRVEKAGVLGLGRPVAKIKFLSESRLFIASATGYSVVYDLNDSCIVAEKHCHTKLITDAKVCGGFLFTASLDNKFKVFTDELALVSSFALDSPIISFDVSLGGESGSQYLFSTYNGGIWVYRDRWRREVRGAGAPPAKRMKTMREYNQCADVVVKEAAEIDIPRGAQRNRYESLIKNFFYRKALALSVRRRDRSEAIAILEYLHTVGRVKQGVSCNEEEVVAELIDLAVDLLGDEGLFAVGASVITEVLRAYPDLLVRAGSAIEDKLEYLLDSVAEEICVRESCALLSSFLDQVLLRHRARE